jgi:hypothetical protein
VAENAALYEDTGFIFADNVSEKKLKKLDLRNTIRS